MACVNFTGFESGDTSECRSSGGTFSVQSTVARNGGYSLKCAPVGSQVANARLGAPRADGRPDGSMDVSTLYTRFYFRLELAPASNHEKILEIADTGGSSKCWFTIDSNRNIRVYSNSGALIDTGSTVLALDTWYRLEFQTSTGSGAQAYEVRIDGVTESSGTMTQLTNQHGSIYLGKRTNLSAQDIIYYIDDVYCDDATWPGAGQNVRLAPIANGSPADWTSGTGSSDYQEIDEIPPSTSDYIQSTTSAASHYVTLTSSSSAGISGTINAAKASALLREVTGVASSSQVSIKVGSSTTETTAYNHSTTNRYVERISEVDPSTSSAWTTSGIDAMSIGVVENNAVAMRCMYMSAFVDFTPSASEDYEANVSSVVSSGTITSTSASYQELATASIAPVSCSGVTPTIAANYESLVTTTLSPISSLGNIPSISGEYQANLSASVLALSTITTIQNVTASYQAIYSASVSPVVCSGALTVINASAEGEAQAELSPISASALLPAVIATYQAEYSASTSITSANVSLNGGSADYQATYSASLSVLSVAGTLPALTAQGEGASVAETYPVQASLSLLEVTASYLSLQSASIEPILSSTSLNNVSAVYSEAYSATVSLLQVSGVLASLTASGSSELLAALAPISVNSEVLGVSASYVQETIASVLPVSAQLILFDITAQQSFVAGLRQEDGLFVLQENNLALIIQR